MKILYICADSGIPVLGKKGASVHIRQLIAAFSRMKHTVRLYAEKSLKAWDDPQPLEGAMLSLFPKDKNKEIISALEDFNKTLNIENSLPKHIQRIIHNKEMFGRLKCKFRMNPPDFIYERVSLYSIAGVLLAKELNRPLILELNSPMALEQSTYRSNSLGDLSAQTEFWMLSNADAILAVSAPLRDYVVSLGVDAKKVHVVPNGVDPQLFFPGDPDPEVRTRWGLGTGPIIGFVGGLRPWHDVQILPALLDSLVKQHPDLKMVIVGEGPSRNEMEIEIAKRKLTQNIVFTGALPHEEMTGLMRQFDIALAPYPKFDHVFYFSPLKLFEYMACGVSVVAADIGQISEVVKDGETGLLYPPGEINSLISCCDSLLQDRDLRKKIGQKAAKEIHAKYTWDHNADRITQLAQALSLTKGEGLNK